MIYVTYLQYKRKTIGNVALVFWFFFWFAGILLILFHPIINALIDPLNIVRVMDLYMILAFLFLFAAVFYLYIRLNKTNLRLAEMARIVALKPVQKSGKNGR